MNNHSDEVMKFNKSRYRSSLGDDHLCAVLRMSTSDFEPDFIALGLAQDRPVRSCLVMYGLDALATFFWLQKFYFLLLISVFFFLFFLSGIS